MTVDPKSLVLILHPEPILRKRANEVNPDDSIVRKVAQKMVEIMFENHGAGLAAPQVGLPWRIFVTRDPDNEELGIVWINPKIETIGDECDSEEEGCLSLPDVRGNIRRPVSIKISGHNIDGKLVDMESDDFIARVWQHEHDHLDGVLIIDKMSAMDRLINRRLIRDLERLK
ncbi:MAG: peptide deformylase [Phycisphaerales bacterium]|nr:peptide deformylase [Phycisphaerales bacterium]